jgi:cytochrome P450
MEVFPPKEELLNPYPFYEKMRQSNPVAYDGENDVWAVFRYDDVYKVLTDYDTFSSDFSRWNRSKERSGPVRQSLISTDPPRHNELRGLISRAFTPLALSALEPRIEEITQSLLDDVVEKGETDLIEEIALPLPVTVIAEMLGVPRQDHPQYKRWANRLLGAEAGNIFLDDTLSADRQKVLEEMDDYFSSVIEQRRKSPKDDLISGLIAAEEAGKRLSREDILSFCSLLLLAGHVTTVNLIGNAILTLLEHPRQMNRLMVDLSLMPQAIEEVLRYRSPAQAIARIVAKETELGGKTLSPGQQMVAWIGSANRDETKFPNANQFEITRNPNHHIAFGHGIHFCIGAPLARLEARIALPIILKRLNNMELVHDTHFEPFDGYLLYGVAHLPLKFSPGKRKKSDGGTTHLVT